VPGVFAVDFVGFFSDLTGGELLLWKVILTTIVFLIAGFEVLFAARFWGVATFPPIAGSTAARFHRVGGRVALALAVLVGFTCLVGPAGPTTPTRALLHSIFGALLFIILAVKFTILRVRRRGDRWLPYLGTALFLTFGAIWFTTVADYVASR
jgi:hypothetical protein